MKLADIKFLKMKRKDYGSAIHGVPVQNFLIWQEWMKKYWGVGVEKEKWNKGCLLSGDNRSRFKKHFGKCAFTYKGNHYFHCWLVDLGTTEVIVLTSREHGTCYEIVKWKDNVAMNMDILRVLEFMDVIAELPE